MSKMFIKHIIVPALFLTFIIGICLSTEPMNEFNQAKSLYELKKYPEAQAAFVDFQKKHPGVEESQTALAYDIMCDFGLKNYDRFLQRLETFRQSNPDHSVWYELDYLKGMALRRQNKWEESWIFFKDYVVKYPESSHRKEAEEISSQSQIELSEAHKVYWGYDFEKARLMYSDFITSYPTHSRLDQVLYHRADCLYQMKKYEEFVKESESLMTERPQGKYNDRVLYLKSAALARLNRGEESRAAIRQFELAFPTSKLLPEMRQILLESYLKYGNLKHMTDEMKPDVKSLIAQRLPECRNNEKLYSFNLSLYSQYYCQYDAPEKWLEILKQERVVSEERYPDLLPAIDYKIVEFYREQWKLKETVDYATQALPRLPDGNPYKRQILVILDNALGNIKIQEEAAKKYNESMNTPPMK